MSPTEKPTQDVAATLSKLLNGKESFFPVQLCANYPQIAEKICSLWLDPVLLHEYFTELLTTQREHREGFPLEIHREIFTLSNYFSTIHPKPNLYDDFWNGFDML